MNNIKNAIWFIRESKKFTGFGYIKMIMKEKLLNKTIYFVKQCNIDENVIKKNGYENYYATTNRSIEF